MTANRYDYNDSTQLSPHFDSGEFRCRCGRAHEILIAEELVEKLELLYAVLNCSRILVTSGYRCPQHDRAVGGTGNGQHTKGTAADICCYGQDGKPVSSKLVCCKAQDIGFKGIANITTAYTSTHVDVRTSGVWYGDEVYGTSTVTDDFYSYYGLSNQTATASDQTAAAHGIDVSSHQGVIDWDAVKASGKVDFAILRAGYGKESSQIDDQFERNYAECTRLGIPVGAYWYSYATTAAEAKQEAAVCMAALKGKRFAYPIAYDIEEEKSLAHADALCSAFCDALESEGYYAAVYTYKSALDYSIGDTVKKRYDIFLSHVGVSQTSYTGDYGIWQYSWTGKINGIDTAVDLDYAYKDYPALIQSIGLNGFTKAAVPDTEVPKENVPDTEQAALVQILMHVKSIDEKL